VGGLVRRIALSTRGSEWTTLGSASLFYFLREAFAPSAAEVVDRPRVKSFMAHAGTLPRGKCGKWKEMGGRLSLVSGHDNGSAKCGPRLTRTGGARGERRARRVPYTHCKTTKKAGDKSGCFARNFENSRLGCLG